MKLMALTFVRTTELIGARWAEFDLKAARWDIPAERMKMKTPHIVPLSSQAVNILKTLHLVSGMGALVFPGERDHEKPMSNNTILGALARMGYKGRMTATGSGASRPRCCMRWASTMPTSSCSSRTRSATR